MSAELQRRVQICAAAWNLDPVAFVRCATEAAVSTVIASNADVAKAVAIVEGK